MSSYSGLRSSEGGGEDTVRVESLAALVRRGANRETIIGGVNEVYSCLRTLPAHAGNDVGPMAKWDDLMRVHSGCLHVLLDRVKVGGYWMAFAISEEAYADARAGENLNASLTEFDLEPMELPGRYQLYLVDLFVLPEYRDAGSANKSVRSFTGHLVWCARSGLLVDRVVTNNSSRSAETTAVKLGFRYVRVHRAHLTPKLGPDGSLRPTRIYQLDLTCSGDPPAILKFDPQLAGVYLQR